MKIAKGKSVSFTGHRTSKIIRTSSDPNIMKKLKEDVCQTIKSLYAQGNTVFLSGMADGFDLTAALAVLQLREEHSEVQLIAVIPFEGQELGYSDEDKATYKHVFENADSVIHTSHEYFKEAFFKRNDYLLDNCGMVVCYSDEQRGGTMYTYNRAKKRGLPIINLFDKSDEDSPLNVR